MTRVTGELARLRAAYAAAREAARAIAGEATAADPAARPRPPPDRGDGIHCRACEGAGRAHTSVGGCRYFDNEGCAACPVCLACGGDGNGRGVGVGVGEPDGRADAGVADPDDLADPRVRLAAGVVAGLAPADLRGALRLLAAGVRALGDHVAAAQATPYAADVARDQAAVAAAALDDLARQVAR